MHEDEWERVCRDDERSAYECANLVPDGGTSAAQRAAALHATRTDEGRHGGQQVEDDHDQGPVIATRTPKLTIYYWHSEIHTFPPSPFPPTINPSGLNYSQSPPDPDKLANFTFSYDASTFTSPLWLPFLRPNFPITSYFSVNYEFRV